MMCQILQIEQMYSNTLFMHQYFYEEMADVNRIESFVINFVTNGYLLKRGT